MRFCSRASDTVEFVVQLFLRDSVGPAKLSDFGLEEELSPSLWDSVIAVVGNPYSAILVSMK